MHALLAVLLLLLALVVPASASAAVEARGSVEQAYVTGAPKGASVALLGRDGRVLRAGRTDRFGSKIWRELRPAAGYRVRVGSGASAKRTKAFSVLRQGQNPPAAFYRGKALKEGLNYVEVRDGVQLAMTVRLPPGKTLADGPFPTVIELSGYQTAAPKDLLASLGSSTDDPLVPASSTIVGAAIARLLDFAVVSVQMRGSGCSGGAFGLFDLPTTYDGYDAVETVAAQPWVRGGKVGMVGISFSGITQLFTAGTRPPSLAAIAPLSVTDDTYRATGYPGGIRNSGFARSWVKDRMDDARPAPAGGQPWARALTRAGDRECIANQKLRLQTEDGIEITERTPFRNPSIFDDRSPGAWMSRIQVPVFLVGQYQDEQTGGHFAESLAQLRRNRRVWISLQNGVHIDSLGPATVTRWVEFLKLYVADEVPRIPDTVLNLSGALYQSVAGAGAAPVEQSRFAGTSDVAAARAVFERDPRVRLLMENGAGPAGLGTLGNAWELGYDAWPIRQIRPSTFFLGFDGAMRPTRSAAGGVTYTADPRARPAQTLAPATASAEAWKAQPKYRWTPVAAGKGLGFVTDPLRSDVVIAGTSSVDLYLRSSARDTDVQVTLSEVRPDGAETYVQSGWLRGSHRKLDARRSSVLDPQPTHLASDAAPMRRGKFELLRVSVFPVAHAFRAGSRIRLTITAPGGDRAIWRFASVDRGRTRNMVSLGGSVPSRLVLPVVAGATAKGTPLPAPTALRGQPSRTYRAASNGG